MNLSCLVNSAACTPMAFPCIVVATVSSLMKHSKIFVGLKLFLLQELKFKIKVLLNILALYRFYVLSSISYNTKHVL